ncbi:hypothetical protein K1T71_003856 [Dendrolimus kikuchii]|uniref:Uncharacterized protein n=1 Tax=Dendrolimus kikuchii TaxID=765133 RepID=A0ACC1D9C0_9NEOP|nr:hypothetical protein K1T71_003856 [Dendrolimus kikuchii]
MESAAKHRNGNREWEKQRRNKFNDAISRLGELVKAINKANSSSTDEDNTQYPKIEIIQKAIICLTNATQEKTQLKAEILALQIKLDAEKNKTIDMKDASTQVYITINKKKKNGKLVKVLMLEKSPNKATKKKLKVNSEEKTVQNLPKLPMLLPRTNINDKKGTENTIVVLPASPYIFPQRPFLIPSVPPAIVLVDQSLQALNKPSVPILSRNNGDITKTTMVNILPISAYSRPLSATKHKKHAVKLKTDNTKKSIKKNKSAEKSKDIVTVTPLNENSSNTVKFSDNLMVEIINSTESQTKIESNNEKESTPKIITTKVNIPEGTNNVATKNISNKKDIITTQINSIEVSNTIKTSKCPIKTSSPITTSITAPAIDAKSKLEENKTNKSTLPKEAVSNIKEKDNKLPNILDQPLCDNVVDGGNARLELAEEFLAASPTAAFLMSFPLVSGNRADSPAEEVNTAQNNLKDVNQKRTDLTTKQGSCYDKPILVDNKVKSNEKIDNSVLDQDKPNDHQKCVTSDAIKLALPKTSTVTPVINATSENPFLNLSMPSLVTTSCTLTDSTFGLDFDCNLSKPVPSQSTNLSNTSNLFYKNDPFSTVKSTIYSTSSISSNHDFNNLGLYPCAMEKYSTKNKSDYANMEDSLMKIGSSRLTYDIDLGWSHKGFDFVSCTTSSGTLTKDSILPASSVPYSSSYNPFNPEFHVPLVSSSNKRDSASSKPTSSFPETITSFYSQATNLWSEDIPFYSSSNITKTSNKHQNYLTFDHSNTNTHMKANISKHYDMKDVAETVSTNVVKSTNINSSQGVTEKYTKKSPNKMHINWMTSEIRPMQTNCNPSIPEIKENHKPSYSNVNHKASYNNLDNINKKYDHNEGNYFPISMHNYPTQTAQEEFQMWPSARPLGTAEVSIEPPPINLPTLVGDLALGPHDKKKTADLSNRVIPHNDVQNCGNFLSVTQLMNRSTDHSRYQATHVDVSKTISMKQNISNYTNDHNNRKVLTSSRVECNPTEPYYVLNDPKVTHNYENVSQCPQIKPKSNSKTEKSVKTQKNNYSAEALIRTGNCTQRILDSNNAKFMMPSSQKYNDFAPQETGVAQISHYPPILDYSDNSYVSQQFSGTTLYNNTTNTISNSFYTNFIPGTSNLITSNYTTGTFTGDFIDYNQSTECNYSNHKYEELKMRNNSIVCLPEKASSNYKTSRRESATKHKLDCTKKESNKKFQSKRAKVNSEVEDWVDPNLMLWQNKSTSKRHPNLISEELPFPNYVGNQMPSQYQPDFFNSHLMPSNMQNVGHNIDRPLSSFPVTSRANFNLSTIFPEITMKVQ